MRRLVIGLVVLALAGGAGIASATRPDADTAVLSRDDVSPIRLTTFWFDDMESGENGWTHGDWTASGAPPRFHVDTYMAYGDTGHSWWCGSFDYDADGGYGNSWYEYLEIPATDMSAAGPYAVLTFAFRYDSEPTYDFTYIQAESLGVYVDLEAWDGYGGWFDIGAYGYLCDAYDNPFKGRFLFSSDGAWSDGDGENTVGGGFACDNVKLFDFYASTVYFYDDVEGGGLCVPGHPGASGDWWHIRYDLCSSYSQPNSWWCGDDADTSLIPGLLQNWLDTPWIDISTALTCTHHCLLHVEIPMVDNDYFTCDVTFDGVTYYNLRAAWGDFGTCDGWSGNANTGWPIDDTAAGWPQSQCQFEWTFFTTANGCGPGTGGGAGMTIDDVWLDGEDTAVETRSWGGIKALYR